MIDNTRREKKERDAMRAEDKYTDETDPVESFERRHKRLHDQWKEDNKEDLKDDMKEYAEKCLQAEREQAASGRLDQTEETRKATTESRDAAGECGDTGSDLAGDTGAAADSSEAKPIDNRKLVYEDIWDDAPAGAGLFETEKRPTDNR